MKSHTGIDPNIKNGLAISSYVIMVLLALIIFGCWGCPRYKVYTAEMEGKAMVAKAHGIAESNRVVGASLQNNTEYLQWLFLDQLSHTHDQIIYLPSGTMGMPVLEANRLLKPTISPIK